MSLRLYRRVSLIPGLRLNASRAGLSLSIGHRDAWLTFGSHGRRRATFGLPGSGLFWTETDPPSPRAACRSQAGLRDRGRRRAGRDLLGHDGRQRRRGRMGAAW